MITRHKARTRRLGTAVAVSAIALIALAGPASAHVSVASDDATAGAPDSILTFRVPNEQDAATTTKVDIKFPVTNPIASVKPAAIPGWVVTSKQVTFNPPIKTDDGTITDGVGEVTYTAAPGNKGIPISGFAAFQILVGPLPKTSQVAFPVVQTYSNGKVSAWIEPVTDPAKPPENPTAILTLQPANAAASPAPAAAAPTVNLSDYAKTSDANTGRTFGLIGLIAGVLGLVLGGIAIGRGRTVAAPEATVREQQPTHN